MSNCSERYYIPAFGGVLARVVLFLDFVLEDEMYSN